MLHLLRPQCMRLIMLTVTRTTIPTITGRPFHSLSAADSTAILAIITGAGFIAVKLG